MKFIDEVTITVQSGKGGPGCVSFRREAHVPRGGPDGGDGGKGGDVVFRVDERLGSLLDLKFKRIYKAQNGEPGQGNQSSGKDGEDAVIAVPPGTIINDEQGQLIHDMGTEGEFVLLKGGRGGKGNTFYKSSVHQAPEIAQKGEPAQECTVHVELKLLADVGLLGFPNVGKSTLISRISAARPKIADYPFTTLVPNLGVVRYGDLRTFVVADIPGLIEGAHEGVGLGFQFLRHVERTGIFVHVVDISGMSGRDPLEDYFIIQEELKRYDRDHREREGFLPLSQRKQIVVLNKIDAIDSAQAEEWKRKFAREAGVDVQLISAVSGLNVNELVFSIGRELFESPPEDWEA